MSLVQQAHAELPSQQLLAVHPSWIAEQISRLPPALQSAGWSTLPESLRARTAALLPKQAVSRHPSPSLGGMMQTYLWRQLRSPAHVPSYALPESPMLRLLALSKTQLVRFIDFLALWELAPELQLLIDQAKWAQVREQLSLEQQAYLEIVLRWKGPPAKQQRLLGLLSDGARFKRAVHERGLARLASAFRAAEAPIVWHLAHRLDTGRGRYLGEAFHRQAGTPLSPRELEHFMALINRIEAAP